MPIIMNYVTFDEDHIPVGDEIIEIYRDSPEYDNLKYFMERHAFPQKKWIKIRANETLYNRVLFKNCTIKDFKALSDKHYNRRLVVHLSENGSISNSIVKLIENLR